MKKIPIENRRILVIDDRLDIREDFRKVLAATANPTDLDQAGAALFDESPIARHSKSFDLSFADQGQTGFHMVEKGVAEKNPYAVIFVDMRMPPGWDGLMTIEQIWKADPNVQVVICTAFSDHPWDEIASRIGETDQLLILRKPFDAVEVEQLAVALTCKWELAKRAQLRMDGINALVDLRYKEMQKTIARLEMEVVTHTAAFQRLNKQFEQFVKDVRQINTSDTGSSS